MTEIGSRGYEVSLHPAAGMRRDGGRYAIGQLNAEAIRKHLAGTPQLDVLMSGKK